MRPLSVAVVRAGLISEDVLGEFKRWGLPVEIVPEEKMLSSPEAVANVVMDALESEDQVRVRDTDFEVLRTYLDAKHQIQAKLHLDNGEGEKSTAKIVVCRTVMGDFAIPWRGDNIAELITNGLTHLTYEVDGEKHKVVFTSVEEMYLGEHKAFMICKPERVHGTR
jgi:hypothetical protein